MAGQDERGKIEAELQEVLSSGLLSAAIHQQGQAILTRLRQPVRLSILGLPKSGKSTLLNLLLGADVVPKDRQVPTLSMIYGARQSVKCTLPNGEVRTLPAPDWAEIARLDPAMVEIAMPLPSLKRLSMMELVAGSDADEQKGALAWAAKRTDISLWCSKDCTAIEQDIWDFMPESLQDHGFLVVTMAESYGKSGGLSQRLTNAKNTAADLFRHVLPIDAQAALTARHPDGSVNREALKASGGIALISAILHEVEAGERAAQDTADIFLRQIDFEPVAAPARPDATPTDVVKPQARPEPRPQPEPVQSKQSGISDLARTVCEQAVEQLTQEGKALAAQMDAGDLDPDAVTAVGVDTVIWLAEYLDENNSASDPVMQRTCTLATEAADLVQLMRLESSDSIALDTLSLMIQLKQEIAAELAA